MDTDRRTLDVSEAGCWYGNSPRRFTVRRVIPVARGRDRLLRATAGGAMTIVAAPLLSWLFLHEFEPVPRLLMVCAAVVAAVVAAWVWQHDLIQRRRRSIAAAMVLTSSLTVTSAVLWNQSFTNFSRQSAHHGIFRRTLQRSTTPSYGVPQWTTLHRGWPAIALGAAAIACVLLMHGDRMTPRRLLLILAFQTGAIFAFASTEGHLRLAGHAWEFRPFIADASQFHGTMDLLARYVQMMPSLSWFGCHYPPGSALLFMAEGAMHGAWPLAFYAIVAAVVGATAAVYFAACELAPTRPRVAMTATLTYAAATGPLVFASLSTTPLLLLPAAVSIWALLRASRTGGVWPAVTLGLCVPAFALVSFSIGFFGIVLVAIALLSIRSRPHVLKTCAIAGGAVVASAAIFKFATGFDFVQCARVGVQQHYFQIQSGGTDGWQPLFLRATGNVLAFLLGNLPLIGIAVAALLLWRRRDWQRQRNVLLPATLAGIFVAAVSGTFVLETERIWLFFIPPLSLAVAVELGRYRRGVDARLAVVMMIAFAVTQELGFIHYR